MKFIDNILDKIVNWISGKIPDPILAIQNRTITEKDYYKAGIFGGATCGFLGAVTILVVRFFGWPPLYPGYPLMTKEKFVAEIFPIILTLQTITGAFLGWLCCKFSWQRKKPRTLRMLILALAFIILVILRQAMSRDALVPFEHYPFYSADGKFIRMGGGILGEPDFETIATGAFAAVSFLFLISSLRKLKCKVPNLRSAFSILCVTTISGSFAWGFVYLVYRVCLQFNLLKYQQIVIRRDVFVVDFPHPERPILAIALNFVYVLTLLIAVIYYSKQKKTVSKIKHKTGSLESIY